MGIGLILWFIIAISLNGLTGWYVTIILWIVGFFIGMIQEEIKSNKIRKENDNKNENNR